MFKTKDDSSIVVFRPLFFIFICIISSLFIMYFAFQCKILEMCFFVGVFICVFIFIIIKKQFAICIISLFLSSLCCIFFTNQYVNFVNSRIDESQTYTITGRADERSVQSNYGASRTLGDCNIYLDDKLLYSGKSIKATFIDFDIQNGDIIKFEAKLKNMQFFSGQGLTYEAYKGVNYTATIFQSQIIDSKSSRLTIQEVIKQNAYDKFDQKMSKDSSGIAYALLFGDKSFLDYDIKDSFVQSGIAHVLAVSGLHTMLLCSVILFILKRIRIRYLYKIIILVCTLFMFCYVCDFCSSVVRASIMAILLSISYLNIRKYDGLNILSFAGIIILFLNPIQIFDVGFILSFSCIFSICLWGSLFSNKLHFIKNKTFRGVISISLCTFIGTLPSMAMFFGKVSLISFLANALLLPFFTFLYTVLFIITVISLIIPSTFIFSFLDLGFLSLINCCKLLATVRYDYVGVCRISIIGLIMTYLFYYISSRKVNLKAKFKIPLCLFLCGLIAINCVLVSLPQFPNNYIVNVENSGSYIVYQKDNTIVIDMLVNQTTLASTKNALLENNVYEIEDLILLNIGFVKDVSLQNFSAQINVKKIYIPQHLYQENIEFLNKYFSKSHVFTMYDASYNTCALFDFYFIRNSKTQSKIDFKFLDRQYEIVSGNF